MGFKGKKTEHSGAKKGRGAFYGRKAAAKKGSNRRRRAMDKGLQSGSPDDPGNRRRGTK